MRVRVIRALRKIRRVLRKAGIPTFVTGASIIMPAQTERYAIRLRSNASVRRDIRTTETAGAWVRIRVAGSTAETADTAAAEVAIVIQEPGTDPNVTLNLKKRPTRATVFPAASDSIATTEAVIAMKGHGTAMNATLNLTIRVLT